MNLPSKLHLYDYEVGDGNFPMLITCGLSLGHTVNALLFKLAVGPLSGIVVVRLGYISKDYTKIGHNL